MKISEIKQLADKEYVKGKVVVKVHDVGSSGNRSYGKISDATGQMDITAWGKDISKYEGKTVEFSGMGMKKSSYNGYDKFEVNEKTNAAEVEPLQNASPVDECPTERPPAKNPAAAAGLTRESFSVDYQDKLGQGVKIALDVEADSDGRVKWTSEDVRAIAISYVIGLNQKGI